MQVTPGAERRVRPWAPLAATAVPWFFLAFAWLALPASGGLGAGADGPGGTAAAYRAGVALMVFWVLSGLSLLGCLFFVLAQRRSAIAWACTLVNALGFAVPILVFAWVNWQSR